MAVQIPRENTNTSMRLLLIEDDAALQVSLQRSLIRSGMQVQVCSDGAAALELWKQDPPDAVLLDLSLPGMDGLDVLKQARGQGLDTPVMVLTARGTVGDRVMGLNAGADDYLPKPFDLDELEARLRALFRRRHGTTSENAATALLAGALRYEKQSGAVYLHGKVLDLPPRELHLLRALMAQPGQAISREQLFGEVFSGEVDVQYEAIEVVVYRLRKKLTGAGVTLVTLRGLGYLLRVEH